MQTIAKLHELCVFLDLKRMPTKKNSTSMKRQKVNRIIKMVSKIAIIGVSPSMAIMINKYDFSKKKKCFFKLYELTYF